MGKKLLRDWHGQRVRLRGEIRTKGGQSAKAGAIGTIRVSGTRAAFEVPACPHCHLSFLVIRLSKDELSLWFEVLDGAGGA